MLKEKLARYIHFIAIILFIAAVGIAGFVTSQHLIAALLITLIAAFVIVFMGFRKFFLHQAPHLDVRDEASAILAATVIVLFGTTVSPWLVWVAAIAVLLIMQQSLAPVRTY